MADTHQVIEDVRTAALATSQGRTVSLGSERYVRDVNALQPGQVCDAGPATVTVVGSGHGPVGIRGATPPTNTDPGTRPHGSVAAFLAAEDEGAQMDFENEDHEDHPAWMMHPSMQPLRLKGEGS